MLVRVEAMRRVRDRHQRIKMGLLRAPNLRPRDRRRGGAPGPGVTRFREGTAWRLHHHIPCRDCFFCRLKAYAQCEVL